MNKGMIKCFHVVGLISCIVGYLFPVLPWNRSLFNQKSMKLDIKANWWETQNQEKSLDLDDPEAIEKLLLDFITHSIDTEEENSQEIMKKVMAKRFQQKERTKQRQIEMTQQLQREGRFTSIHEQYSIKNDNFEDISNYYGLCLDYLGEFACLRGVAPPINTTRPIKEFLSIETIAELMEVVNALDPLTMNLDYVSFSLKDISREYNHYPMEKLYEICERERIMLPYGEYTVVNKNNYERICNFLNILGVEHRPLFGRRREVNKENEVDPNEVKDVDALIEEQYYSQFTDEFADIPMIRTNNNVVFGSDDDDNRSNSGEEGEDDDALFTKIGDLSD